MTIQSNTRLADIVRQHHLTAQVLEKYKLDFCCNGKVSLEEACADKALNATDVLNELHVAITDTTATPGKTASMNVEELIDYIVEQHHEYVLQQGTAIQMHLTKVAGKHGERFPYMVNVWQIFMPAFDELRFHLQQEEELLFPRIKEVYRASQLQSNRIFSEAYLQAPINALEAEHDRTGAALEQIRALTNDYAIPDGACNTFLLLLTELKEFEADLHRHVHLENHVLFPAAMLLLDAA